MPSVYTHLVFFPSPICQLKSKLHAEPGPPRSHKVAARAFRAACILDHVPLEELLKALLRIRRLFPRARLALPWSKRASACLPLNAYWWEDSDHLALGVPENDCCRYTVGPRSPTGLSRCTESLSCGLLPPSQAAYLVGVSDPNSQAGHQGLVDPIQFARANQAIQMACQNLVDPGSSPSQVTLGRGRGWGMWGLCILELSEVGARRLEEWRLLFFSELARPAR